MLRARPRPLVPGRTPVAATLALLTAIGGVVAGPAMAQDDDEPAGLVLPGSGREVPLYVVEGDIFILADRDWCENLIALTEEEREGEAAPADAARVDRCERFLGRLADNDVVLLPRSLAAQLVVLPDELLVPAATPLPSLVLPSGSGSGTGHGSVSVSGRGESRSTTFLLVDGDYEAQVEAGPGCEFLAAFLTEATSGIAVHDIEADARLRDVTAGAYFWDVLAPGCDWSITLRLV